MRLWEKLGMDMERDCRIALVGGGGKTTVLYALAQDAWERGKWVLVTTTTHMRLHPGLPLAGDKEALTGRIAGRGIAIAGVLVPDGRVGLAEGI